MDGQALHLARPDGRRGLSGHAAFGQARAYAADITYATNNEIGFDYLRDNMALAKDDRFQRGLTTRSSTKSTRS